MSISKTEAFLKKHSILPELTDPVKACVAMAEDMRAGLIGAESSMPMIPTYLSNDGVIPKGEPVAVIDAGGTNFRTALVSFDDEGYNVAELKKRSMPGVKEPCTWEEFISFVADSIEPLLDRTDRIGFCFSYSAEITPEMDGRVLRIDKEVVVTGSDGQLIGASLNRELERRGIKGKRIVILNDTVAVLLGGAALLDKTKYSAFAGQVSGTGTNTCVSLPCREIKKLGMDSEQGMLINLESGLYQGIPSGDIDKRLDRESNNPGSKLFEKLTAGAYLGELCRLCLRAAAEEGLLSVGSVERISRIGEIDSADVDAWSKDQRVEAISDNRGDQEFVRELSRAILRRSATCMCVNLLALALLTGQGRAASKPLCVCAEGSLVQKCDRYRRELESLLKLCGEDQMKIFIELRVGQETTLPGSAAAALLNG